MPKWYGGSTLNPAGFVPPRNQWRDQWERLLRWFARVEAIHKKSLRKEIDADDNDVVIAFFQNCNHLRDWLKASRPELESDLNALFRGNFEMRACRNICDGYKHKKLDNPSHPDPDFNLYREYDPFGLMDGGQPVRPRVVFTDGPDIRKFDLFELAFECMRLWQGFLLRQGLVT
ncbi:MAG TPA: hypothetical protein VFE51_08500 [Verrucomicrobiae bacterium]|nr:hypothetical protein [Verrucomicrobiae bacterium]